MIDSESHRVRALPALAVSFACALAALALAAAPHAAAATRFAAPHGAGASPCSERANPCPLWVAADIANGATSGDKVIVLAGEYADAAGDLGPSGTVTLHTGVRMEGEAGKPAPVIRLTGPEPAFVADIGDLVSNLTIHSQADGGRAFTALDGTVERVLATTSGKSATTCGVHNAILQDTACLASGTGAVAIIAAPSGLSAQTESTLKSVTANATGAGSRGIVIVAAGADGVFLDARATIAQGVARDLTLLAGEESQIRFREIGSIWSTIEKQGSTVVEGLPSDLEPLFAPDGYHQLPSSPTVDLLDPGFPGAELDIDGQERSIGGKIDVGADELGRVATVEVLCDPNPVLLPGGTSACAATVSEPSGSGPPPAGTVTMAPLPEPPFDGAAIGSFSGGGSCAPLMIAANQARCKLTFTPGVAEAGTRTIAVSYSGDKLRDGASSTGSLTIEGSAAPPPGEGGGASGGGGSAPPPTPAAAPDTKLSRKPLKKSRKRAVRFAFSAEQAGSSFECKLDRKPFKRCLSPFKRLLQPGAHSFQVRALNAEGVADATPAVYRWRILR